MATSHTLSTHLPGQKRSKTTKTTLCAIIFYSSFFLLFLASEIFFLLLGLFHGRKQNRTLRSETQRLFRMRWARNRPARIGTDWLGLALQGDAELVLSLLISSTFISLFRRCEQIHKLCTLASLCSLSFCFVFIFSTHPRPPEADSTAAAVRISLRRLWRSTRLLIDVK